MTTIKICGLSTVEDALAAATAGANFIGLVFAPSRRRVTIEQARAMVSALRQQSVGSCVHVVGLFVNEAPDNINAIIERCELDYVQLSGDEMLEQAVGIHCPVIKALRFNGSPTEDGWLNLLANSFQRSDLPQPVAITLQKGRLDLAPCPLLVDAHVPGSYGGTGTLANWEHAAALAKCQPLILAGGLTPENVATAIAQVRPWGVDVSSGVEVDGRKHPALIEAFIRAVRSGV